MRSGGTRWPEFHELVLRAAPIRFDRSKPDLRPHLRGIPMGEAPAPSRCLGLLGLSFHSEGSELAGGRRDLFRSYRRVRAHEFAGELPLVEALAPGLPLLTHRQWELKSEAVRI